MVKKIEIVVGGNVQGVGYRAHAVRNARLLNISGSVKNLYDGRVKVIASGEEENIRRFIETLQSGPLRAFVSELECREFDNETEYNGFDIEY